MKALLFNKLIALILIQNHYVDAENTDAVRISDSLQNVPGEMASCLDKSEYRYADFEYQTCGWIRSTESRREKLCVDAEVATNCPFTCGYCCEDDSNYQFFNNMKQQKGCEWISTLTLQKVYCSSWRSGQMVQDACPKVCNFCPAKLAGSAAISASPLLFATHTTGSEEKQTEQRNERDDIFFARAVDRRLETEQCLNDPSFTVDGVHGQSCTWLRDQDQNNRGNHCVKPEVVMKCPQSCGCCCDDDDNVSFIQFSNAASQRCSWIAANPRKRGFYCDMTENAPNPSPKGPPYFESTPSLGDFSLKDYCPVTCDICATKLLGTICPSPFPSSMPTLSAKPSSYPSTRPSSTVSLIPSGNPSNEASSGPSALPSMMPSVTPSTSPSDDPSASPTSTPSSSSRPSDIPSSMPSISPSTAPSSSALPSSSPSSSPSTAPSVYPSALPSSSPSNRPSDIPSSMPSSSPSTAPSVYPSALPSSSPSNRPSRMPSDYPSALPSLSSRPSDIPSSMPSSSPSTAPSVYPSALPSSNPSDSPSDIPSSNPSNRPSDIPSSSPTAASDAQVIEFLYDSTNGYTSWTDKWRPFLRGYCDYVGVTCNVSNEVTAIELGNNNLSGTIPSQIGLLNKLVTLVLNDNVLYGSIPSEIGNLVELTELRLENNEDLSGNIPISLCELSVVIDVNNSNITECNSETPSSSPTYVHTLGS